MIDEKVTRLDKFAAPYGREVTLENVDYDKQYSITNKI